jgi:hypothetical protein
MLIVNPDGLVQVVPPPVETGVLEIDKAPYDP